MELKTILKWRNVWMGIAMLWMVVYHSGIVFPIKILSYVQQIGYGGVDVFLFASGLGCYYSLDKNDDFADFIKRRIKRIIPTYWFFLLFWTIYKVITVSLSVTAVIGNFLCIQSYTGLGNDFNWYISAMWTLYFLAPFFYSKMKTYSSIRQYIGMFIVLMLFTIPFWNSAIYVIAVTRFPIFFIGMSAAKLAKDKNPYISIKQIIGISVVMLLGVVLLLYCYKYQAAYLWSYGLYWYPFILIVPGMCLLISCAMELISKFSIGKWVEKPLSLVGRYSFEIYLVHAFIYDMYRYYFAAIDMKYNSNKWWLVVMLMIIPICILFVKGDKLCQQLGRKILKCNI